MLAVGMADLSTILESLARAQEQRHAQTTKAIEDRYAGILGILKGNQGLAQSQLNATGQFLHDRIGGAEGLLESSGTKARRESGRQYEEDLAQGEQDLIGRGMAGNPILAQAARRRAGESFSNRNSDIREQTDRAKLGAYLNTTGDLASFMLNRTGIETGLAGQVAGAMERRTDEYPDTGAYADLIRQLAASTNSTPGRTYNTIGAGGGGRGGGFSPASGGRGDTGPSSSYGTGGGGSGGGGSSGGGGGGVRTFTNSGFSGPMRGFGDALNPISGTDMFTSGPSMIGTGSSIFLGGRALGPDGTVQGVGGTAGGPRLENPGYLQVRNLDTGTSGGYANGAVPPGWEDFLGDTSGSDDAAMAMGDVPVPAENTLGKATASGGATKAGSGAGAADAMVSAVKVLRGGDTQVVKVPRSRAKWNGNLQRWEVA